MTDSAKPICQWCGNRAADLTEHEEGCELVYRYERQEADALLGLGVPEDVDTDYDRPDEENGEPPDSVIEGYIEERRGI